MTKLQEAAYNDVVLNKAQGVFWWGGHAIGW